MKIKKSKSTRVFNTIAFTVVTILTLICLLPFWMIVIGSFTDNHYIVTKGYQLFPEKFSLAAYQSIFAMPAGILNAYKVTIIVTICGAALGLFLISMAGYVLQRKDFKYRNKLSFFIYFTTLFQGGLIPWYILITNYLHLSDSLLALILPSLMSPFLIILMRSFISMSVPDEVIESAKIDGANDFKIFHSIVLHLAAPGLATIGLFLGLHYWNDWFLCMLFISTPAKYSLQFFMYNILNGAEFLRNMGTSTGVSAAVDLPSESTRLAIAVLVVGPIVFLYPFIQRYFVKGLTIGAVKG